MMRATLLSSLLAAVPIALATTSPKRGIIYVDPEIETDNNFWTNQKDDLTWYYNYESTPTDAFDGSEMEFVPMQWGLPEDYQTSTVFYDAVQSLQKSGTNVSYVLGFNEPDGCSNGGSCVDAKEAAVAWVTQFEPMRQKLGVKLGGPACTGASSGWTWLQEFHTECAVMHGNGSQGCEMDFLPLHWYGSWDGFASHFYQAQSTYKNISEFWVTEFAYNDEPLAVTQQFYNQTTTFMDNSTAIGKYAWFGAFRSSVSNVGPNVTFLTSNGELTDIGSWYLGGGATGNIPTSNATVTEEQNSTFTAIPGTYSGKPYGAASGLQIPGSGVLGLLALALGMALAL